MGGYKNLRDLTDMNVYTKYVVVFITANDNKEAELLSRVILNNKKAACVSIVPGIVSSFWWQGSISSSQELLLIVKTTITLIDELINLVKSIHTYEVPEIIAMPILGGNIKYFRWLEESLQ